MRSVFLKRAAASSSSAVAVQCLETAFEVSTDDQSLAVPMTLPEIFASATAKVDGEERLFLSVKSGQPSFLLKVIPFPGSV